MRSVAAAVKSTTPSTPAQGGCRSLTHAHALSRPTPRRGRHRDHVQVHHVGRRAAQLAATPRVLEVTMPRELLCRTTDLARLLRLPAPYDPGGRPHCVCSAGDHHPPDRRPPFRATEARCTRCPSLPDHWPGRAHVRGTTSTASPSVRLTLRP
jgi:hypothetical protein